MKSNQLDPIEVGYTDEDKVIFNLRRVSVAESDELDARLADAEDAADKYQKQFEIRRDALADFSAAMPEKYIKVNGELQRVPLMPESEDAGETLRRRFAERSIENEWIIRDAFLRFKQALQPGSRFFAAFRIVAWQYVYYAEKRRKIDPAFDQCPQECPNAVKIFDLDRSKYCETCPQKKGRDNFKAAADGFLKERLGRGKSYAFDDLLSVLYSVIGAEDLPRNLMSVKTAALLDVYLQEKNRKEKIDEKKRENKNNG